MKNKVILTAILLIASLGIYTSVSDGSIRTVEFVFIMAIGAVEFVFIMAIGALAGVLLTQMFNQLKEKENRLTDHTNPPIISI